MATREEIIKALDAGERPQPTGAVARRSAEIDRALADIGLADYGRTKGFKPYSGFAGSSGIDPSPSTRALGASYARATRTDPSLRPDKPWYDRLIPDPLEPIIEAGLSLEKERLKYTGGVFMKGLEVVTIPLALAAASIEDLALNAWALADYDSMPTTAKKAYAELQASLGDGPAYERALNAAMGWWRRRDDGAHEFMYGTGDIFNTFDFLQADSWREGNWWANRILAFTGDMAIDPVGKLRAFGKIPMAINRGLSAGTGNGLKLGRHFTQNRLLSQMDDVLRVAQGPRTVASRAAGDIGDDARQAILGRMSNKHFLQRLFGDIEYYSRTGSIRADSLLMRQGDDVAVDFGKKFGNFDAARPIFEVGGTAQKVVNPALHVKLEREFVDEVGRIAKLGKEAFDKGLLGLDNADYSFLARSMREAGMDQFFRVAGDSGFAGVLSSQAVKHAGLNLGLMWPGTGLVARKLAVNPVRRMIGKHALDGPVPMLTWSASNRFLGLPMAAGARMARAVFVGKGNRWSTYGGRMTKAKKVARDTSDPVLAQEIRSVVHAVARGAGQGRVAAQELGRVWKEVETLLKANPLTARTNPDGGRLAMAALRGDEEALRAIAASDQVLADQLMGMFGQMRQLANKRAQIEFLGEVANYAPRHLSEGARDRLSTLRPGLVAKRHKTKPFDKAGFEKGRRYIDTEEFAALVKEQQDAGKSLEEAIEYVSKTLGKSDEIFGLKLHKPGTVMPDGTVAGAVEDQITDAMADMGMSYGLFVDDIYEVMPNYVQGLAERVGEVFTEALLTKTHGIFVDRMASLVRIPPRVIQKHWIKVMKGQVSLKRASAQVQESLQQIADATGAEIRFLQKQLSERQAILDQAEEAYIRAVDQFDEAAKAAQEAEQVVINAEKEVDDLAATLAALDKEISVADVKKAARLERERVEIMERLASLEADENIPRHHLERLRSATVSQIEMERGIHAVFKDSETMESFERLFRGWQDDTPVTAETLHKFVRDNADAPAFAGNVDIIDDTQFVLRIQGREKGISNEYEADRVLEMLLNANRLLDDVDASPLGTWLGVQQAIGPEAATVRPIRLQNYVQAYRRVKREANDSAEYLQDWLHRHPAVWQGEIPTAEAVEEARAAILKFTGEAQVNGQTFGDALIELGADDALRSHLHTYYSVHSDLSHIGLTSLGDIDQVLAQMTTALRQRGKEIGKALDGYQSINFEVVVRKGMHGEARYKMGLAEYAQYQQLREAAQHGAFGDRMPLRIRRYPVDDIITDGHQNGGQYIMDTVNGPKKFYVKRHVSSESANGEVLANALYREMGGDAATAPMSYASYSEEQKAWYVVSEWMDDLVHVSSVASGAGPSSARRLMRGGAIPRVISAQDAHALQAVAGEDIVPVSEFVGRHYLADVLLGNADAVGLNSDNLAFTQAGSLVRINNSGSFFFGKNGVPRDALWDYRTVGELETLGKTGPGYDLVYGEWERSLPDGITSALVNQFETLDEVRKRYGGWSSWVRKHLPEASTGEADEFIRFLEARHRGIARKLDQNFNEGIDLVKEALTARGVWADEAEEIVKGKYGPKQASSARNKYEPWQYGNSQALDTFSASAAREAARKGASNKRARAPRSRITTAIDRVSDWLDGGWGRGMETRNKFAAETANVEANFSDLDRVAGPDVDNIIALSEADIANKPAFLNSIETDVFKGAKPPSNLGDGQVGVILLDRNGEFVMRMPFDNAQGTPSGPLWEFPVGMVREGEEAIKAAHRLADSEIGVKVTFLDAFDEDGVGFYIGVQDIGMEAGVEAPVLSTKRLDGSLAMTQDPKVWDDVMQMIHYGPRNQMIDPTGVPIGMTPYADDFGLNLSTGAVENAKPMTMGGQANIAYAADVNIGIAGDRVRIYGLPAHLHVASIANARAQTIHATQPALEEALSIYSRQAGPFSDALAASHVFNADISADMFARVRAADRQLYDDIVLNIRDWEKNAPDYLSRNEIPVALSRRLQMLEELSDFGISQIDQMDYSTKVLFFSHLEDVGRVGPATPGDWDSLRFLTTDASQMEMEASVFLGKIDESMNPVDAWTYKTYLMTKVTRDQTPGSLSADLSIYRNNMGKGEQRPHLIEEILRGPGRQPGHARPREMRYSRFMNVYRRSMMADGYTVAAWSNPETHRLGSRAVTHGEHGAPLNFIMIDPWAVNATPRTARGFRDQATRARVGVEDSGFLDAERFLDDYERLVEDTLLVNRPAGASDGADAIETVYARRVQAAMDLDGPGGPMEQLNAARAQLFAAREKAHILKEVREAAKSQTAAAKKFKTRPGAPTQQEITDRALQILNQNPTKHPTLTNEAKRASFARRDRELRREARSQLIAVPSEAPGLETISRMKELEIAIESATKRQKAAENAIGILRKLGTVDEQGRSIPLDKLPVEVRNLKMAVGALVDADAEQIRMALRYLEDGADSARWLRQVGEYGDDEIFFPLRKGFMKEKYLDTAFEAGFKPFGVNAQGPEDLVEMMTTIERFRDGGPGAWGRFLSHYDRLHNLTKGYMIMKPGFHMRNYFSAVFMNYLAGVKMGSYRAFQNAYWNYQHERALELGLTQRAAQIKSGMKKPHRLIFGKASADDVAIVRRMDEEGILGGSQGQIGVEFTIGGKTQSTKVGRALAAINPFNSRNYPLSVSKDAGVGVETFVRGAMGFDSLKRGDGIDVAFERIMKWHFDYSDLADWEKGIVKRVVPFYTWTRKALPLMVEQMALNPRWVSQYMITKKNIEGEEGRHKFDVPVPKWMIRQGGIQLPFKFRGENMWILPDLPFKTPLEMLDPLTAPGSGGPTERMRMAMGTLFTQMTPLLKAPVEWYSEKNFWKDYHFTGRYEQVPTIYTRGLPGLMGMLDAIGVAEKNRDDKWMMRDKDLHFMATLLPVYSDLRRMFPSEERYQQRTLSTWMSVAFGLGLRTNTREEQQRTLDSAYYERLDEDSERYKRRAAKLPPR